MDLSAHTHHHAACGGKRIGGNHRGIQNIAWAIGIFLIEIALRTGDHNRLVRAYGQIEQIGGFFQCCGTVGDHRTGYCVVHKQCTQCVDQPKHGGRVDHRAVDTRMFARTNVSNSRKCRYVRNEFFCTCSRDVPAQSCIILGCDRAARAYDPDYGFAHNDTLIMTRGINCPVVLAEHSTGTFCGAGYASFG